MIEIDTNISRTQLEIKLLDIAYRGLRVSIVSSLLLAILIVFALWPTVEKETLLAWFAAVLVIMVLRFQLLCPFQAPGYDFAFQPGSNKWKSGFIISASAAGICWGSTVFLFPAAPSDPATLLVIFFIAGVTAFASVSMASVPSAATIFMACALLPLALWLFSFGKRLDLVLGLISLLYFGTMVMFSIKSYRSICNLISLEGILVQREQESRTLVENSPDTISRYNQGCRRIFVNQAFGKMVEGGLASLLGKRPTECPGGEDAEQYEAKIREVFKTGNNSEFELRWLDKNDREIVSHIRLTAEYDSSGEVVSVLSVGRDITELNEHRKRVHQMAFYDSLTSLPNRVLFNDRLRQMITDASWYGQQAGVMLLDLDRFKAVNDTLGHSAGDALLREAATRLTYSVRNYDTVARLGGDEFAILLPGIRSGDDLGCVANKIIEAFKDPFLLEGKEISVTTSVGISVYPADSEDSDGLLKQADSAMYFAKRSGRNTFRYFSKSFE